MDIAKKICEKHGESKKEYRFEYFPDEKLLSNIVDPVVVKLTENKDSKGMYNQLHLFIFKRKTPCIYSLQIVH
jgi:hypothetical protein